MKRLTLTALAIMSICAVTYGQHKPAADTTKKKAPVTKTAPAPKPKAAADTAKKKTTTPKKSTTPKKAPTAPDKKM